MPVLGAFVLGVVQDPCVIMDTGTPFLIFLGAELLGLTLGRPVAALEARVAQIGIENLFPHFFRIVIGVASLGVVSGIPTKATFLRGDGFVRLVRLV